mgnify:CR=1 FL=1
MARTGSFGVPANWIYNSGATTRGPQGNYNIDQGKARKYFRGLTPQYNFSDQDLDILIAGQDIPGVAGDYAIPGSGIRAKAVNVPTDFALPGGSTQGSGSQAPLPPGPNASDDEIDRWKEYTESPEYQATLIGAGQGSSGASTPPAVPPPPPAGPVTTGPGGLAVESTDPEYVSPESIDSFIGQGPPQRPSDPRYDVEGDTFYGIGGQYIDPVTGIILKGRGDFRSPNISEVFDVNNTKYQDIFDPLQYGYIPSRTMQYLDQIGLGLDFIRNNAEALYAQNPNFLQSWWQNTFLPAYNERMRDADRSVEISGGATFNPFANMGFAGQFEPMGFQNLQFPGLGQFNVNDFSVDPSTAANIRSGVAAGIDPFTAADFGIGPDDLDAFFGPITDRMSGLSDEFRTGGYGGVADLLGNLENRLDDIRSFDAGDQFLAQPTDAAQNLFEMLYGLPGGMGPRAKGIAGFRAPDSIQQLSDAIGTFGPEGTGIGGQISALQNALGNIDLSGLVAPTGLDDLVSQITNLGALTSPAVAGIGQLQNALGAFDQQDRAALDMLMQIIGPQGIASLNPNELNAMLDQFKGLASGMFELPDFSKLIGPQLDNLLGPGSEFYQDVIDNIIQRVPTGKDIADEIEIPEFEPGPAPGPTPGPTPGPEPSVDTGGLSEYLESLKRGIEGTSALDTTPITSEYLRTEDPITQSFLADLAEQQEQDEQEMMEQLQRFGIITSGEAGEQMFDLASAQRREELDVLSDAATRVEEERRGRYADALELGRTLQQREIGLAELLGIIDGQKTLAGREYDLDILATVIAAMDPNLDLTGASEEQNLLASVLLDMLNRDPNATASDFIARIRESLNLPGKQ